MSEIPTTKEIVDKYLPNVEWVDATWGKCLCPGHLKHSHQPAKRDCRVYINGVPTVTCFHSLCESEVRDTNNKIRTAWGLYQPPVDEEQLRLSREKAAARRELENRATASVSVILKDYAREFSRNQLVLDRQYFLRDMFGPDDVIWIGQPEDSGWFSHKEKFRPTKEWNGNFANAALGRYTTASTYKPGSYSRSNGNLLTTPYMIVEGDRVLGDCVTDADKQANKAACAAIFNWLEKKVNLTLRAVVDSGNKSLHGWFNMPSPHVFEELKIILPAMGCDRAMQKPAQPARLPGVLRENNNLQRLLYLA